ncbi:ABC transporter substrate-binding protein [Desulfobulbus rhabdoformis]|uniref:ABC transporter substrate-binding protein n=1 Tax=Desulfobulbus rhabdoformis TaxID=34032 RepID=UPI001964E58F|nr:ABC transporter substrate binding protein [Desulfobulbus rhabdoformis]MBM9617022.1 ABC transporter substrate-binding protein [Desulfobulbus rhabdoformis]
MLKTKIFGVVLLIVSFSGVFISSCFAKNEPRLNNGKKWRVAYYEGGPFSEYTDTMRTLVAGLIELGWITKENPPDYHQEMPKPFLDWLIKSNSPYLSIEPENCYSANWDDKVRVKFKNELLSKLKNGAIDLVIAMGTWAGQDLASNDHSIPVMVLSTSDPIRAGIIKSAEDSGFDHVTARVDPTRYLRQIRMFHRIAGFNTLGIAFENSPDGKIYSALNEARQVAKERNFQIVTCEVHDSIPDFTESDQSCYQCYRELIKKADAVYVTALACADRRTSEIADILKNGSVPSFSLLGSKGVKEGLLLSISSDSGYAELGRYNSDKFGKILNGSMPRTLNQIFRDPLDIAVNLETAKAIHFDIPKSILKIATEIYGE